MDRRLFVRWSAALAATSMLERNGVAVAAAGAGSPGDEQLRALLDTFLDEVFDEQPQSATLWGLDSGPHAARRSRLDDYSAQGPGRWLASCNSRLTSRPCRRTGYAGRSTAIASGRARPAATSSATSNG